MRFSHDVRSGRDVSCPYKKPSIIYGLSRDFPHAMLPVKTRSISRKNSLDR